MKEDRKCLVEVRIFDNGCAEREEIVLPTSKRKQEPNKEQRYPEAFISSTLDDMKEQLTAMGKRLSELEGMAVDLRTITSVLKSNAGWAASNMPTEIRMMSAMVSELHAAFLEEKGTEDKKG